MEPTVLTTEEEGIGILAGAWLGGERGVLLMQSSGVGNCINMLSLAKVCSFPLLMIVSMRGEWGEANPWQVPMGQIAAENLRLAGVIVYEVTDPEAAAPAVEAAARIAFIAPQCGRANTRRSPGYARGDGSRVADLRLRGCG
jgi:sulfopyruvate decarboxylase alpha subunit